MKNNNMLEKNICVIIHNYYLGENYIISIKNISDINTIKLIREKDLCLETKPNNIVSPTNFYNFVSEKAEKHIVDKILSFSNGRLTILQPISIHLNIIHFFWETVIFNRKIDLKISSNKFCFNKNTCLDEANFEINLTNKCQKNSFCLQQNTFEQRVVFIFSDNENYIDFSGSKFMKDSIFGITQMKQALKQNIDFNKCVFGSSNRNSETSFHNFQFSGLVDFSNITFYNNVYFNNSTFCDYADFHESIFENIASFYNVNFKAIPNFSGCIFKNTRVINFINVKIKDITMSEIDNFITQQKNGINNTKQDDLEHKICHTNNIRDSFRIIKDILIVNNNLLDASQWHKYELYAKEKELEFLMEKQEKNIENNVFMIIQLRHYC